MKIRKNDNVVMLSGKDRGKKGKVLFTFPEDDKVIVEGLNMVKKHQRARKEGQKGQIISKERKVSVSNVQLICPKCGQRTRIGHKIEGDLKLRICKKCLSDI
jgi:large subunit ribosomal protein L24